MAIKTKKSTKPKFVPDFHHHTFEAVRKMCSTFMDAAGIAAAGGSADAAFWVNCQPGWLMGGKLDGVKGEATTTKGMHGYFPDVPAMRASLIANGPGIAAGRDLGVIDMRAIAPAVAARLGVSLRDAEKPAAF